MKKMEANLGPQKIQKSKVLKIKIRSAQIVGEVFYAGERRPRPIWGPPGPFFPWAGKIQKLSEFCLFSLVGQWANSANRFESADPAGRYAEPTTRVGSLLI